MPIEMIAESLEEVPEALRANAVERDGKFVFDGTSIINSAQGWMTDLQKKKAELKKYEGLDAEAARKAMAALEGVDPNEAKEAVKRLKDLENKKLEEAGEFEKLKTKWNDEKAKELGELKGVIETQVKELTFFKLDNKVRSAAIEGGVLAEDLEDAINLTRSRFRLGPKDEILVLDKEGDESTITLEQFWKETYKQEKPKFYAPTGAAGSGAPTNHAGGGGSRTIKTKADFKTVSDKVEFIKKNGQQAFESLPNK